MMRVIPAGIVGLFLVSSAAAALPPQTGYDLKSQGDMSALDTANAKAPGSPFTMTLLVDLNHQLVCQNNCETQERISKVLPSNIIFRAINAPLPNRLWVADAGQFSYTWADVTAHNEKPSVRSAQGYCTKVMADSGIAVEAAAKQKSPAVVAQKPVVAAPKVVT